MYDLIAAREGHKHYGRGTLMNISVFLADDHTMFRQGIKLLLENEKNITVVGESSNGRETVREVIKKKPDIVVLDIFMPEMNGIDAADAIREELHDIKIIILTMNSSKEHIFQGIQGRCIGLSPEGTCR